MSGNSSSVLDEFSVEIQTWRRIGKSNPEIVGLLERNGVFTSEASIRRAFRRWRPEPRIEDAVPPSQALNVREPKTKWGVGRASRVSPATGGESEIVVVGSDFHFPYQNDALIDAFIELIVAVDPHRVILNGDLSDFFGLSRFNTSLERLDDLQDEIDMTNEFRRRVRDAAPDAVIDETDGNHDSRIVSFVKHNAKALWTLRALEPSALFLYDELDINWHPAAGFLLRPQFLVKHGTLLRSECPNTAKAELTAANISGLSGHTHRLGTYRKSGYVQRQWTEIGGFFRQDPDYVIGQPNWQNGCVVAEFSTRSDAFVVHEVPAVNDKLALFSLGVV